MRRKILKVLGLVLAVAVVAAALLVANAERVIGRDYGEIAEPPIKADTSHAGVARGEMLFQSLCMECHGGPDGRATGKALDEVPEFLGQFWSANLAHPQRGVLQQTDGQIARALRFGVLSDGRLSPVMSGFGKLGDRDVAALLGYMRSGAPAFEPAGAAQPKSQVSLLGKLIITYVAKLDVSAVKPSGIAVPPKAPTVEYGRYMANTLDCATCHTDGFAPDKAEEPGAFAGGFEMLDPTGAKIWTRNITRDEATGIGRWSLDEFERAVTRGVNKDGYLVRKPMPLFARLDRTDIEAIWRFLETVPKVSRPNRTGGHALQRATTNDPPELTFVKVGCASCHGDGQPHRDKLQGALDKSEAELTAWILDPQATKPGSIMPSFRGILDPAQAAALAGYAKELARRRGPVARVQP